MINSSQKVQQLMSLKYSLESTECSYFFVQLSLIFNSVPFINVYLVIHSPPLKIRRGFLIFEIWTKGGVMKKLLRNRRLVERGEILLERGVSKLFHQFSFRKACFHYYWNTIFCLVIFTLAVINRLFFRVVYFLLENDIL